MMARWEKRANKEILSALHLDSLALRDSLPEPLSLIVQVLCTATSRSEARAKWEQDEGKRVGKVHGRKRAGSKDYTIVQFIFEYHILRQIICDVMEEEKVLDPVDREIIVSAIEQAVNDAATQFGDTVAEAQERLASTLTHGSRGPLTVTILAAQRILRHADDAELCAKAAGRIERSIGRLEQMVQSLLDVTRELGAGQLGGEEPSLAVAGA